MVTILSPTLLEDESLGFNVQMMADILAFGTIGAMLGKMVWGPLGNRIGGQLVLPWTAKTLGLQPIWVRQVLFLFAC